jgi:hypothetical protein
MSKLPTWATLEELHRLDTAAEESSRQGHRLDAAAYRGAAQQIRDLMAGIDRCPNCGRIRHKRRMEND